MSHTVAKVFCACVVLTLFLLANAADDRTCYYLDGSTANNHVPCTTNSVTNCCGSNDICLSNGLCYLQGSQGLSLSRGTCSDKNWGSDCYKPCSSYRRNTGMPIMNIGYNYSSTQYCCGTVIVDNNAVGCKYEDPFELTEATVIPGVAYLANNGVNGNSTSSPSSSSCIAVEAGVSIPLGVIAIAAGIWALWERRRRRRQPRNYSPMSDAEGSVSVAPAPSHSHQTAELGGQGVAMPLPELMDTRTEYREAPSKP
ncbi:hypothetical protein BDV39DRAFT_213095 [Aspergillus sergii]|uniref:Uncharacterized protein n=1 Tax=Aspergillus sergii TaxID=1034303 RepID=A0A5N6XAP2_9EURO|nr:hypothetical protein BDV39DRAFT_213095 [Aspergillus sergii]